MSSLHSKIFAFLFRSVNNYVVKQSNPCDCFRTMDLCTTVCSGCFLKGIFTFYNLFVIIIVFYADIFISIELSELRTLAVLFLCLFSCFSIIQPATARYRKNPAKTIAQNNIKNMPSIFSPLKIFI